MAYNRRNILLRIIDIQEYTLSKTSCGVTQQYIYDNYIRPTYRISKSTFDTYLATNAKRELKQLDRKAKKDE